jgi:hypothetical protein
MIPKRCPMCDLEMERIEDEPDVGIVGGWYCSHCEHSPDTGFDDYDESDYDDPR